MPQHIAIRDRRGVESFKKIGEDVLLGSVLIDLDKCKGCEYCTRACPAGCLEVVDKKSRMIADLPFCFSCGDCTAICPENAITLVDFIVFKRHFRYLDRGAPMTPRRF